MASLEREYRLLLVAYPAGYRRDHEEEIIGTLLEAAREGQRHPSLREAAALLTGGLRVRGQVTTRAGRVAVWADGLRLAALVLLGELIASTTLYSPFDRTWLVVAGLLAVAVVAVVLGRTFTGLAIVLAAAALDLQVYGILTNQMPGVEPMVVSSGVLSLLLIIGVLAGYARLRPGRHPWPPALAAVVIGCAGLVSLTYPTIGQGYQVLTPAALGGIPPDLAVPVVVLGALLLLTGDARLGIGAAASVAVQLPDTAARIVMFGLFEMWEGNFLVIAGLAVGAMAVIVARRQRPGPD